MHKSSASKVSTLALVIALAIFGLTLTPATARAQVDGPEPVEPAPLPITSVNLIGEVFANGHAIGAVDFAVIFSEDNPSQVQLWAILNGNPSPVCIGDVFESPQGEPVFHGTTSLMEPAGTCMMSQLPDRSGITLHAASNDGQWASAILRSPDGVDVMPIFG